MNWRWREQAVPEIVEVTRQRSEVRIPWSATIVGPIPFCKPARVVVFRIELSLDEEERKAQKSSETYLKLWLDGEGVPLAMERDVQAKFSKFLIGFRIHEHDTRTYQCAGGRLVVTHATHDTSGAGLGHTEEAHTTTNVTLLP